MMAFISPTPKHTAHLSHWREGWGYNPNSTTKLGTKNVGLQHSVVEQLCPSGEMYFLKGQQLRNWNISTIQPRTYRGSLCWGREARKKERKNHIQFTRIIYLIFIIYLSFVSLYYCQLLYMEASVSTFSGLILIICPYASFTSSMPSC